jgi:hypothetical protein
LAKPKSINRTTCRPESAGADEDVPRLQVAMNHPHRVCGCERIANLRGDADRATPAHRPLARKQIGERLALEELHHEIVMDAVAKDIAHLHDVGVPDAPNRARFIAEKLEGGLVGDNLGVEHLERRSVAVRLATGAEHPARAPLAENAGQDERSQPVPELQRKVLLRDLNWARKRGRLLLEEAFLADLQLL